MSFSNIINDDNSIKSIIVNDNIRKEDDELTVRKLNFLINTNFKKLRFEFKKNLFYSKPNENTYDQIIKSNRSFNTNPTISNQPNKLNTISDIGNNPKESIMNIYNNQVKDDYSSKIKNYNKEVKLNIDLTSLNDQIDKLKNKEMTKVKEMEKENKGLYESKLSLDLLKNHPFSEYKSNSIYVLRISEILNERKKKRRESLGQYLFAENMNQEEEGIVSHLSINDNDYRNRNIIEKSEILNINIFKDLSIKLNIEERGKKFHRKGSLSNDVYLKANQVKTRIENTINLLIKEYEEEYKEYKRNISKLSIQIKEISENILKLENLKEEVIEILNSHYHRVLFIGKDCREEGISWTVKKIFLLKKDVIEEFFPWYLDEKGVEYIFNIVRIDMEKDILKESILKMKSEKRKENQMKQVRESIEVKGKNNIRQSNKRKSTIGKEIILKTICKVKESLKDLKKNEFSTINSDIIKSISIFNRKEQGNKLSLQKQQEVLLEMYNNKLLNEINNNRVIEKYKDKRRSEGFGSSIYNIKSRFNSKTPLFSEEINKNPNFNKLKEYFNYKKKAIERKNTIEEAEFLKILKKEEEKLKEIENRKESLKNDEFERISKEVIHNDYLKKFNVNKKLLLLGLFGENSICKYLNLIDSKVKEYKKNMVKCKMYYR